MIKVVLVEDEIHLRRGMSMFTPWEEYGCVLIGEASNAFEGAEMIRRLQPDIAIVDICMPGKSGLEMIRELAGMAGTEYILLSGYSDFEYARTAISLGVTGYLLKPVDDGELEKTIRATIEKVEKRRKQARLERDMHRLEEIPAPMDAARRTLPDSLYTKDALVEKALKIIEAECGSGLVLAAVAERLNISESYLGKLFRQKLGYTFGETLTAYRMKRAAQLLRETDLRIYEIATSLGYRDARHFSNVFRNAFGMNPTDFRNEP